ncbi:MAG: GNAT family N-acetyltransferase [Prevotella sp.]|jgi:ribosomal protein S18 acetylase RimI-like enzyme|nr:GNAT family N-acetyltransferase [Prevotella sp.]
MIFPVVIEYKSKAYDEMVTLRQKILRDPLGLVFSEEFLKQDENDILLGLSAPRPRRIAACCILTAKDEKTVKLRQMAVDNNDQGLGFGKSMLKFAELVASDKGFDKIVLHARKVAIGFYQKYDYKIIGEEFMEVEMPHYKMEKQLNKE